MAAEPWAAGVVGSEAAVGAGHVPWCMGERSETSV
jgi:hypothetical protein